MLIPYVIEVEKGMDGSAKNLYEMIAMHHEYFEQQLAAEHGVVCGDYREDRDYSCIRHHGCSDWLIIYTLSGAGTVSAGNHFHETQPGEFVLWQPGVYQDYKTSGDHWDLLWAHVIPSQDWMKYLQWSPIEPGLEWAFIPTTDGRRKIESVFRQMLRNYTGPYRQRYELARSSLHELLIWIDVYRDDSSASIVDYRILQAQEFLCEGYAEDVSLEDVAGHVGLSVSRLVALFKAQTGLTVKDYLEKQRILHAQNMLRYSGGTISEVSERCGFNHPFYFSRRFKQHTGMSPREFRKQISVGADS